MLLLCFGLKLKEYGQNRHYKYKFFIFLFYLFPSLIMNIFVDFQMDLDPARSPGHRILFELHEDHYFVKLQGTVTTDPGLSLVRKTILLKTCLPPECYCTFPQICVILLGLLLVYDVFFVFITPFFTPVRHNPIILHSPHTLKYCTLLLKIKCVQVDVQSMSVFPGTEWREHHGASSPWPRRSWGEGNHFVILSVCLHACINAEVCLLY